MGPPGVIEVIYNGADHIVIALLGSPELLLQQRSLLLVSPMERGLFLVVPAARVRSGSQKELRHPRVPVGGRDV